MCNPVKAEQVDSFLDAHVDDMVTLLATLVSCRTDSQTQGPTDFLLEAKKCQGVLADEMKSIGLEVDMVDFGDYPAIVGHLPGTGAGRSLALNGHFDVVPVGAPTAWQSDPWTLNERSGVLYGRGTVDMKAGLVSQLFALRSLAECGAALGGDVWVHYVSDEEVVGQSTRLILTTRPRPEGVVDSEPTGLAIMPVEAGLVHLRVEVIGEETHAANRYTTLYPGPDPRGSNAIEKVLKVVNAMQSLEQVWAKKRQHPLLPAGFNTIAPGLIFGGPGGGRDGRLNIVSNAGTTPDYASVEFNIWFLPTESFDAIRAEIEDYLSHVCAVDPWLRAHPPKLTWKLNGIYYPPCATPSDHPVVAGLVKALRSLELPSDVRAFAAASELAWYSEAGVCGSLFGPGAIDQAHSPNESLELADVVRAAKVIARLVFEFCGS